MPNAILHSLSEHPEALTSSERRLCSLAIAAEQLEEVATTISFQYPFFAAQVRQLAHNLRDWIYQQLEKE